MNLKKRTQEEIETSVNNKDYTGGYEFLPWLIYMRKWHVIGLLGNLGMGIAIAFSITKDDSVFMWLFSGFFGIAITGLILYMLIRDYKMSKNGLSS